MKDKDDTGISKSSSKSSSSCEDADDLELAIAKSKEKMVLVGGHVQVPVGIAVDQDDNQDDDAKQFQVDQDDDLAILKMKATSEKDELIVTKMYPVAHSTARAGGILVEEEDDVDENVDMDLMEIVQLRSLEASINRDVELAVPQTRMSRSNGVAVWRESIPGAFPMDGIASSGQGQATGLEDSSDETQSTATDAPPRNDNPTAAASDILNALVEAQPVDPNATDNLGVAQPMPGPDQKDNSFWQRHGKDILIGSLVLALILGFVFGFAVGRDTSTATTTTTTTIINTNTAPTSTPSLAPTSSPTLSPTQLVLDALPDFTLAALADPDSPQSKAYQWLLDDDQDLDEYPQWRRLQRFALATLYYATKGHLWERTDGWMSHNVSECHWIQTGGFNSTLFNNGHVYVSAFIEMVMNLFLTGQLNMGVFAAAPSDEEESFCNDQGRIAILHLANGLAGTVPNEIGFLTDISELVFWRNIDIVGSLPTTLGLLTALKQIHLSSNAQLQGPIPSEIGRLSNLKHFSFDSCPLLTGTIPTEIGLLTSLYSFHSHTSGLTGPLPSELGLLHQNLQLIHTRGAQLSGSVPSELTRLTELRFLAIGAGAFTGPMPPYNISHWSETLEFLDVSGNLMTGTLSTELGKLHKMRMMSLDENHFTSTIPTELGRMGDSIQFLRFWRNDLSGTVPSELGQLSGLLDLAMHENPLLSGTVPPEVCTTPQRFLWFNCTSRLCGCGADFCPCSA